MTLFSPNSICCGSIELCFPHPCKQQHHLYPLSYFWSFPWWEGCYSKPRKNIEVIITIIIWRKFSQLLLPASGWYLLRLKIDKLRTKVAFFDPSLAVSHWIDSVRRLRRRRFYLFYISICRILCRYWTGRGAFRFGILMQLRAVLLLWAPATPAGFPTKDFNLLLDFQQRLLNLEIWHTQRLLNSMIWNHERLSKFQDLKPLRCNRRLLNSNI